MLKLVKDGLNGDMLAAGDATKALEAYEANKDETEPLAAIVFALVPIAVWSVGWALEPLHIAKKLDRYRDTARYLLESWIVEESIARLGEKKLSIEDQKIVLEATHTPKKG